MTDEGKEPGWIVTLLKHGEQVERIECQYMVDVQDAILHAVRVGATEFQGVRKRAS